MARTKSSKSSEKSAANLGPRNADTFRQDLHPNLKADFILADPPFNVSDWGGANLREVRWKFGMPPVKSANCTGIQQFVHHLSLLRVAGFRQAKTKRSALSCSMKIRADVHKYTAEGISG